ncbi:hypothetical protein GE118_04205 [Mycoplasma sp. NEAQ87857]|uniref:hypothetical protein n=1 Tax=Mycoplasma sp. NEAQ87857 TaxID=2683967 RepID=UPI0013187D15|nr:hypothetical protein [Mycoplasma sp. NEAQ87857]QGZ97979.1 hypothetical protein GE118_04205 [Mycoplasma sp. NEAQ87857]
MSHYVAEKHTGLEYLQFRSEHENEAELSAMMLMKWIGIEDEDAYQKSKEYAYQWLTAKSFTNADANLSKEERIKKAFEENHDKLLKLIENAGKIASEVIKTFSLEEVRREYSNDKWKLHQEVDDFRKINEPNLLTYKEIINNIDDSKRNLEEWQYESNIELQTWIKLKDKINNSSLSDDDKYQFLFNKNSLEEVETREWKSIAFAYYMNKDQREPKIENNKIQDKVQEENEGMKLTQ